MEMNIPSSASSTHLDLQRVFKGASGVGSRCTGGRAAMQRTADPWTRVQIPARAPIIFYFLGLLFFIFHSPKSIPTKDPNKDWKED